MPRVQRRVETVRRGSNRAAPMAAADATSSEGGGGEVPKIVGCPVLDPIECQCPKHAIDDEGVKMTCTWEPCPFAKLPLHNECYQMLEDNLVKRLATLGSARGWTVPQRRNNLWEKKGQALIGRFCRCRCGHGQMTRDKQALYEKEKAVEKEKKKKAKKTKQLPQLQFNSKPAAALEDKKRDQAEANGRSFSTTSRSRLLTDRSTTSTCRTLTFFDTPSQTSSVADNARSSSSGLRPYQQQPPTAVYMPSDSEDTDEDDDPFRIVPAPPPPPQKKSYAATIKKASTTTTTTSSSSSCSSSELFQQMGHLELTELGVGDFLDDSPPTRQDSHNDESLNPLGLSILSPVDSSELPDIDVFLPDVTSTPALDVYAKLAEIREKKRVPRLPLASSASSSSSSSSSNASMTSSELATSPLMMSAASSESLQNSYGIRFTAPVREMMDIWAATNASLITCGEEAARIEDSDGSPLDNWTPMFGRGFNLGERLMYFP